MSLRSSISTQTGSALIISLLMLIAVTLLAIISMESSTLQLKMVSNSQKSKEVFECSISELEANFRESTQNNSEILDTLNEARYNLVIESDGSETYLETVGTSIAPCPGASTLSVLYTGLAFNPNDTFNDDTSVGTFEYLDFDLRADSSLAGRFTSEQILGIKRIAPKTQ